MDKVKILVACHKPAKVYQDDVYTPIQVGKALHPDLDLGYITDATGDNISNKNGNYSELTAQYWAWKNLKDVEYIGLCHYQRYFQHRISKENVDSLLGNHSDIILIEPITEYINLGERLMMWTSREDFYLFYKCFEKVHPEDFDSFRIVLNQNHFSPFNMFVMKKELFDEFAEWQFSIFSEMEKYVRISGYSRQKRLFGYLSEILLRVFSKARSLKVSFDKVVNEEGNITWPEYNFRWYYTCYKLDFSFIISHGLRACRREFEPDFSAVDVGMKQDGIRII